MCTATLSCKLRIERMLYPRKDTPFNAGDFAILACYITDVIEGEPYDREHIVIKGPVFTADIGVVYQFKGTLYKDSKYGQGYKIDFSSKNLR